MTNSYQTKRKFPYIPGIEGSGIVLKSKSSKFKPGTKVMFSTRGKLGTFSSFLVLDESSCFEFPNELSFEEACCYLVGYTTAYHTLVEKGKISNLKSSKILICGATGGMGVAACQLAKCYNAKIIILGGSNTKLNKIEEIIGSESILLKVNYKSCENIKKEVRQVVPEGVDLVWDCVGGDRFIECLQCVKYGGKVLIVGFTSGIIPKVAMNYVLVKELSILGCRAGETLLRSENGEDMKKQRFETLFQFTKDGKLKPYIHKQFQFNVNGVKNALKSLMNRDVVGRIVVSDTSAKI